MSCNKTQTNSEKMGSIDNRIFKFLWINELIREKLSPRFCQLSAVITDQGTRTILRFFTGVIIARLCTEDYSYYILLQTFFGYSLFLSSSLVISPYMVFFHKKNINKEIYNHIVSLIMAFIFVVIVIVFASVYSLFFKGNYLNLNFFMISLFVVLSDIFNNYVRMLFIANFRYSLSAISGLSSTFIFFSITGILYLFNSYEIQNILISLIAAYVLPSTIMWAIYLKGERVNNTLTMFCRILLDHLKFGKWILFDSILNYSSDASFPVIAKLLHKDELIPSIGVCLALFGLLNPVTIIMQNLFAPRFAQSFNQSIDCFRDTFKRYLVLSIVVFIPIILIVSIFGNIIIKFFYGNEFVVPIAVLIIWGLARVVEMISALFNNAVKVFERTDAIFKSSLVSFAIFVVIGIWLINIYGTLGVAISILTTKFIRGIILGKYAKFYLKQPNLHY